MRRRYVAVDRRLFPAHLYLTRLDFNPVGTWLADLAGLEHDNDSSRKHLSLHGVDLGSTLFRKDPRLDLRNHDVRKPFPELWGWKNSFDLVHQRLLVWGIGANEWSTVLKNLADVVKPGGVLQLVEAEWVLSSYTDEQVQQKRLAKVQRWSTESSGMDVDIWKKFPDLLQPLGFRDVKEETFSLGYGATSKRPEDRIWTAELLPQSFRHLARKMPSQLICDSCYECWLTLFQRKGFQGLQRRRRNT